MSTWRFVLTALGWSTGAFVIWLLVNISWPRTLEMALYGALFGAIGVLYGLGMARYVVDVRPREGGER